MSINFDDLKKFSKRILINDIILQRQVWNCLLQLIKVTVSRPTGSNEPGRQE